MNNNYLPFAFFKDDYIPIDQAVMPIMARASQYGAGIFGGMRGYYSKKNDVLFIFRLDDHIKRLFKSIKFFNARFKHSQNEIKEITLTLTKKNKPISNVYFRFYIFDSSINISPILNQDDVLDFALYMLPMEEYMSVTNGLSLNTSSWQRISDAAIPARGKISGLYISSIIARSDALKQGFDEAIFLNKDGHVSETTSANIFIVRDGQLITPPIYHDILEGITRKTVIEIAHDQKIPFIERPIDRSELIVADEVFITGTAVQIAWVKMIDNRIIADGKRGEITHVLQDTFFSIISGTEPRFAKYLTPIIISQK